MKETFLSPKIVDLTLEPALVGSPSIQSPCPAFAASEPVHNLSRSVFSQDLTSVPQSKSAVLDPSTGNVRDKREGTYSFMELWVK